MAATISTTLRSAAELAEKIAGKNPAWFCVHAQPKHEHIAAAHLRQSGTEIFFPQIRFQRAFRHKSGWITEALFPGYFFARFSLEQSLRHIRHIRGVRTVVHFGEQWPTISESVMDELRRLIGENELHVVESKLLPGDGVEVMDGSLRGFFATVLCVHSGRERVALLMEFLGRQTRVELPLAAVVKAVSAREIILGSHS